MGIINNPNFLQQVILLIANEAYKSDVVDTDMIDSLIGDGKDYESKEQWIHDWISERFDDVKQRMLTFRAKNTGTVEDDKLQDAFVMSARFYSLGLGDEFDLNNFIKIVRVPGGWIYHSTNPNSPGQSFVPFNTEFKMDLEVFNDIEKRK
jgi:hypothetical protein